MIKSMTGFGRAEAELDGFKVTAEIRSVNHRYFELTSRIPRAFGFLEDKLKTLISARLFRGKVDAFVSVEETAESVGAAVTVNHALAKGYVEAIGELSDTYGLSGELMAVNLVRFPELFSVRKTAVDEDRVWAAVEAAVLPALDKLIEMRAFEGDKLKEDILFRTAQIGEMVRTVETRSPLIAAEYRKKLELRLRELLDNVQVDEQRLLTETAIIADKTAVAEETVRLKSHIAQMGNILETGGAVGRKLDFLVQEFNREANTIGSKVQDLEIINLVVELKSEIEKIREQVQNIE